MRRHSRNGVNRVSNEMNYLQAKYKVWCNSIKLLSQYSVSPIL